MELKVFCAGGTIDKIYYDALSDYQIGDPQVAAIMQESNVQFEYAIESVLKKDSLEMNDEDRQAILDQVRAEPCRNILITHGTDTMVKTAQVLEQVTDKTIVLVGSMQPARFKDSDATFNIGFAVAAARLLPVGVYIAMNGNVLPANEATKNRAAGVFELQG